MLASTLVGQNIDTFIGNARVNGSFPDEFAHHLEKLRRQSQEVGEDIPTKWRFAGEALFVKYDGACLLHSPGSMRLARHSPHDRSGRASPSPGAVPLARQLRDQRKLKILEETENAWPRMRRRAPRLRRWQSADSDSDPGRSLLESTTRSLATHLALPRGFGLPAPLSPLPNMLSLTV